jgi:hypothetical protein
VFRVKSITTSFLTRLAGDLQFIGIWSIIELGFAISAACLATLRPLLTAFIRRYRSQEISSKRHWLFGPKSSRNQNSCSSMPNVSNNNYKWMMFLKPAKHTAEVKRDSWEARDSGNFLHSTSTTHTDARPPPERWYGAYNITPALPMENRNSSQESPDKTNLYSVFNDLETQQKSMTTTHSGSPGTVSPELQTIAVPTHSHSSSGMSWQARSSGSRRATWWPVSQSPIKEDENLIKMEKVDKGWT